MYAASMVAASNEVVLAHADIRGGYIGPLLLTAEGPVQLSEERLSVGLRATAISNSGAVVLGSQGYFNGTRSFRWTAETGIQEFGIDEKSSVFPNALSGNGQVIVGLIYDSPTPFLVEETVISNGFRWNESEGFSMIPNESEERRFVPTATSFDGSLIVGNGVDVNRRSYVLDQSASELLEPRAIAWTEETGTQLLELPTQFKSSSVVDVSDDGRLIVGAAILENPLELGDPPSTEGVPVLVDGKRAAEIVASKSRAMLWDENRQALDLQQWLKDHHHLSDALEGWTLTSASAISANGRIIAGLGVNPDGDLQGWVVTIPEPCTLALSAFPLLLLSLWQRQVCLLTGRKCGSGDPRLDPRPHPH
ncbi:MAG: hypothetical protein GXP24_00350 [Planctomycetes bacterium]|nr:hypothetical protein [Planctomycetota bacterium]